MKRNHPAWGALLLLTSVAAPAPAQTPSQSSPSHGASDSDGAPDSAEGVVLNLARFEIPFSVAPTGSPPIEVELYWSRDGRNWEIHGSQPASSRSFPFEADADGVFWFATRTIDARGGAHPTGPLAPQLKVTVDTANPRVEAAADADGDGRIVLDYRIADRTTDPRGLQIQYRTDTVPQWMPVERATGSEATPTQNGFEGRLVWTPESEWRHAQVRLVVRDRAGNQTVETRQLERPRVARLPMQLASAPRAAANHLPAPRHAEPARNEPARDDATRNDTPREEAFDLQPPRQSAERAAPPAAAGEHREPPAPRRVESLPSPYAPYVPTPAPQNRWRGYDASRSGSSSGAQRPAESMRPTAVDGRLPAEREAPASDADATVSPPADSPAGDTPPDGASRIEDRLPPGETPRMSRSKKFSLDYEVDALGSAGVEDVELWGTRDGGESWQRWGVDPDRLSPFDIEVSGEGLYGFSIVVVGNNGLTSPRPLDGEPADIYVSVDATSPAVRLTAAEYGEGKRTGSLVIRWTCSDAALAERPISLAFAADPDGPWTTIATGLENTREYLWPADPQLPRQIYLRIEAADQAGNVGTHVLDMPIDVQGLAPRARIRGFSPIDRADTSKPSRERSAELPRARFR